MSLISSDPCIPRSLKPVFVMYTRSAGVALKKHCPPQARWGGRNFPTPWRRKLKGDAGLQGFLEIKDTHRS